MSLLRITLAGLLMAQSSHADLIADFQQGDRKDSRFDRLPAISVPLNQAATPFLQTGKFEVKWSGFIQISKRKRFYLSFEGEGDAKISIENKIIHEEKGILGKTKSERFMLNPGRHPIEIAYTSKEDGTASFRLYWEEEGVPKQTIPPQMYSSDSKETVLESEKKRKGRESFAQHHCAKCHLPENGFGANPMPEVTEIAPILAGIGDRVTEAWLTQWIADPKSLKPGTKMPHLIDLTTAQGLADAADLGAYMATFQFGQKAAPAPAADLTRQGGVLFHELGCISCHHAPDIGLVNGDSSRVPLNNVAYKFQPGQLTEYLKKPESYHVFTAMPNFQLTENEANALAAYLTEKARGKQTYFDNEFPKGDATRGAMLAESLNCGTCHPGLPGSTPKGPSLETIFQKNWAEKGCVSLEEKRSHLPKMNFLEQERENLQSFSQHGISSLKQDHPAEFAERQISSKNCTACHSLDEIASDLETLHSTTAHLLKEVPKRNNRVDQSRPSLSFMGEMLHSSYIQSVLKGDAKPRPRPWLATRMPAFSTYATSLATGMANMHGFEASTPEELIADPALAKIGEQLIGKEGFGCTTCHGFGDQKATAAFEVGAINFDLSPHRLRKEFYHRWMNHPASITPSSKMPKYSEGNRSKRFDILHGDAYQQYEAIWHWLHSR